MSLRPAVIDSEQEDPSSNSAKDRRRFRRVALPLEGRFMREDKNEYPCRMRDISVGGLAVLTSVEVEPGEKIIAYIDNLGGFQGHVVRVFDDGFAMEIHATRHKREKLAANLTWTLNRFDVDEVEERRHQRVSLPTPISTLKLSDGTVLDCSISDISLTGAFVVTVARPRLGSIVMLGKHAARVMRHHENGIGVEFSQPGRGKFSTETTD